MTHYPRGFTKVKLPEGKSGEVEVQRFTVTEEGARRFAMQNICYGRSVPAGDYTRLLIGGQIMMSDTPDEARDHRELLWNARGDVLINGLGIGLALHAVLRKPEVESVTVVELSEDVIKLVGPSYDDPRVTIVQADALEWRPERGRRFGAVWHDIWPNICSDNLEEMHRLHRAYGRRCDWQGSWCRYECERLRREYW